ncbi:MAG: transpeptidase family protein [Candidatus Hydrogenedentota bacterium]|nr:MAG: transpeptidase family protein [Candidatus Hydrogenedentota bacterium]
MREDTAFKMHGSVLAGEKLENPSRLRAKLCLGLLLLGFAAIGTKLIRIQVFDHDFWLRYVDEQRKSAIVIYPKRGTVYDHNSIPLATSVVQEVLCVAPHHISDEAKVARDLSPYVKMPAEKIIEKIRNTQLSLVYLRRGFDVETANKVRAMKIEGVEFRSESSRHYPKGVLASNLIGFANLENKGLEGVEYKFDAQLAGEPGKQIIIKDNSRRQIVALAQTVKKAQDGNHIVLTIDEVIQYITEKALEGMMRSFSPESATAIVINPKTGEVLAMACRPTFDPNEPSTYEIERLRNRVVTDAFEPGSAFKPVAAAAALELNVITPQDRVYCELGTMRYHGHTFKDVHPLAEISFADVIAQSSNIGMIKVASLLQPEWLYGYIRRFGFGELTGIDLPGESAGIVRPPSEWSGLSMGSLPIGHEIGVTTLQLAVAFSTIANKGRLMRPYVVSTILSPDGKILKQTTPRAVRQAIQPDTAKSLTKMLERVVTCGTGSLARLNGYSCAGKTGTAQRPDLSRGGYLRDKYVSVFAGFVPAEDPAACIVVVADSSRREHYGGRVAAPAFKEIAQGILNYLEIPPTVREEHPSPRPDRPLLNARLHAHRIAAEESLAARLNRPPRMPDIRGMTMRAVLTSLSTYSLRFEFEGSGVAFRQSPGPGEKIQRGQRCEVAFKRKDTK